jgi:arginyl-tRNA synthetase
MPSAALEIEGRLRAAATSAYGEVSDLDLKLRPSTKPGFGHLQSNIALRPSKTVGAAARDVADRLASLLADDQLYSVNAAGPASSTSPLPATAWSPRRTRPSATHDSA